MLIELCGGSVEIMKISNKNQTGLFGSGIWSMISLSSVALVGFVTMPIIINGIGTDHFGLYSIILMVGGFVALQDLGLGEATLKFVSNYYSKNDIKGINRVLGATLSIYLISGTVFCVSIIVFAPQITGIFKISNENYSEAVLSLRIASIGFLFVTVATSMQKISEAILRYDVSSKIMIFLTITHGISIILVVKLGFGLTGLVSVLAAKSILMLCLYSIFAKKLLPEINIFPNFNKEGIREVFSYGVFSFTNQVIGSLSSYIDKLILGILLGTKEVAYLSAPKDILDRAASFVGAAGRALLVKFSMLEENEKESKKLYLDSNWILFSLTLSIFIPILIVLPEFISLWISEEFSKSSAFVAQLIGIGVILRGVTHSYFAYLRGSGKVHWLTIMFLISSGLSILLSILLINIYGFLGAGLRILTMSFSSIFLWIFVLKKGLKTNTLYMDFFRSIGVPFTIGFLNYFLFSLVWKNLSFNSWFFLIAGYLFFFSLTGFTIFISDIFAFGKKGAAYLLFIKLRSIIVILKK
jgi:O-antigen/teichoic acid export membrane protein